MQGASPSSPASLPRRRESSLRGRRGYNRILGAAVVKLDSRLRGNDGEYWVNDGVYWASDAVCCRTNHLVIPAQAGIQFAQVTTPAVKSDSRLRGNDAANRGRAERRWCSRLN